MKKTWVLSLLSTVAVMGVITYFSGQPAAQSHGLSRMLARKLLALLPFAARAGLVPTLNWLLRKLAHFGLYLLLGLSLYGTVSAQKRVPAPAAAVALGFLFAVSDELHQAFSLGRSSTVRDVLIDTCGAAVGALLAVFWCKRKKKKTGMSTREREGFPSSPPQRQ